MSDNTQTANAAADNQAIDPVLADALGLSQPASKSVEPVTSPAESKQKSEGTTTEGNAKVEQPKVEGTDDKKTDDTKKEETKVEENKTEVLEIEVAGKKYTKFEDAVEAVKKIAGDNSRITGDNKSLTKSNLELTEQVKNLSGLMEQYKTANEEWKKYYEEGGEKPDTTTVDIEAKITEALEKHEKSKSELNRKEQYQSELDEIFKDPEIETVLPVFKEMIEEYGDSPKVSPKKLFERAKKLAKGDDYKDLKSIDEMVEERVKKELAKLEASKVSGNTGGGTTKPTEQKVDPVLADALKDAGIL